MFKKILSVFGALYLCAFLAVLGFVFLINMIFYSLR